MSYAEGADSLTRIDASQEVSILVELTSQCSYRNHTQINNCDNIQIEELLELNGLVTNKVMLNAEVVKVVKKATQVEVEVKVATKKSTQVRVEVPFL